MWVLSVKMASVCGGGNYPYFHIEGEREQYIGSSPGPLLMLLRVQIMFDHPKLVNSCTIPGTEIHVHTPIFLYLDAS